MTLFLSSAIEDFVLENADCFRLGRDLLGIPGSRVPKFRESIKQGTELAAWKSETWVLSSVLPCSTSGDLEGFQYPLSV